MTKITARAELGFLIRSCREKFRGLGRAKLARESGVKRKIIVKIEHGIVNPKRSEFITLLCSMRNTAKMSNKDYDKARKLLNVIYPRKRVKFHLPISVLRHRNRCRFY